MNTSPVTLSLSEAAAAHNAAPDHFRELRRDERVYRGRDYETNEPKMDLAGFAYAYYTRMRCHGDESKWILEYNKARIHEISQKLASRSVYHWHCWQKHSPGSSINGRCLSHPLRVAEPFDYIKEFGDSEIHGDLRPRYFEPEWYFQHAPAQVLTQIFDDFTSKNAQGKALLGSEVLCAVIAQGDMSKAQAELDKYGRCVSGATGVLTRKLKEASFCRFPYRMKVQQADPRRRDNRDRPQTHIVMEKIPADGLILGPAVGATCIGPATGGV